MVPVLTTEESLELLELLDTEQLFDLLDYARHSPSPETFRVKMCEWLSRRKTLLLVNSMKDAWDQQCRLREIRRKVLLG